MKKLRVPRSSNSAEDIQGGKGSSKEIVPVSSGPWLMFNWMSLLKGHNKKRREQKAKLPLTRQEIIKCNIPHILLGSL